MVGFFCCCLVWLADTNRLDLLLDTLGDGNNDSKNNLQRGVLHLRPAYLTDDGGMGDANDDDEQDVETEVTGTTNDVEQENDKENEEEQNENADEGEDLEEERNSDPETDEVDDIADNHGVQQQKTN